MLILFNKKNNNKFRNLEFMISLIIDHQRPFLDTYWPLNNNAHKCTLSGQNQILKKNSHKLKIIRSLKPFSPLNKK
jgi:hypothetical protein